MLALFTYYSDFTLNVRKLPGNILIKNCKVKGCDRFLHYDFTGTHVWQKNKPLTSIAFENITASGIGMPFNAYGDKEYPITLKIKDSDISFSQPNDCVIRAGNYALVQVENTTFTNVVGAMVKSYGTAGEIVADNVQGINEVCVFTEEKFESQSI